MNRPLVASLTMHIVLCMTAIFLAPKGSAGKGNGNSDKPGQQGTEQKGKGNGGTAEQTHGEIVDKIESIPVMQITPEVQQAINKQSMHMRQEQMPKRKISQDKCKHFYGGIGVHQDFFGQIYRIAKGHPADQVGVRIGDTMIGNPRGTIGEPVTFQIVRNGEVHEFTVIREKICLSE